MEGSPSYDANEQERARRGHAGHGEANDTPQATSEKEMMEDTDKTAGQDAVSGEELGGDVANQEKSPMMMCMEQMQRTRY